MHILEFLQGFDLRNPTRSLSMMGDLDGTARINLMEAGFAPGPGKQNTRWSGKNPRRHGQRRTDSNRENGEATLKYALSGRSQTDAELLQRKIHSFFRDAGLFEEEKQSEPIWMRVMFGETGGLETLPAPVLGQLARYIRILSGDVERWPESLYTGDLNSALGYSHIIGIEMTLVYEPFFYSLPQQAGAVLAGDAEDTIDGVLIGGNDGITWPATTTVTPSIMAWVKVGWTPGTDDVCIFHFYIDANNQIRLHWDSGTGAWVATITKGGTDADDSYVMAISANDLLHLAIIYDDGVLRLYVNAAQVAETAASDAVFGAATFVLGGSVDGTQTGGDAIMDGHHLFDYAVSEEELLAIYTAELPAKMQAATDLQNNAWIGAPTWWGTPGVNQVESPGYGVLGGVNGDVDALVEWHVVPADTFTVEFNSVWLGRKASTEVFDPFGNFIFQALSSFELLSISHVPAYP